jgi:ferredoxin
MTVDVPSDVYILDAAEEAGVELPFWCRDGDCYTCVGKILSGTIDNSLQKTLTEE